ncbi:MAG: 2-keto-3-deoxy-galactonokinase [Alphaproteobacteria bacterium]|jgi:2-dehydro-3-deoxygalactonokinase|nr:2-keto-3-deoxy-galactonokinase [Alphaproteobacteria bacterium]
MDVVAHTRIVATARRLAAGHGRARDGWGRAMTAAYDWLAVDWSHRRLRAWAMADGEVVDTRETPWGMTRLAGPPAFATAFAALVEDWTPARRPAAVVVCGMAGAREGWHPAAYAAHDGDLRELPRAAVRVPDGAAGFDIRILPGLRQAEPPDVMRGEETRLLGLVADTPDAGGVVVLPGMHGKWVQLARGRVARFRTAMTGEVFAAVAEHTLLRHTLGDNGDDEWDAGDFAAAVAEGRDAPAALLRRAFGLRAEAILNGLAPDLARARLSGWLTGLEIADALAQFGEPRRVTLVGEPPQVERYAAALAVFGVASDRRDGGALARAGLIRAHRRLFGGARP